jgi:hypothetical protein
MSVIFVAEPFDPFGSQAVWASGFAGVDVRGGALRDGAAVAAPRRMLLRHFGADDAIGMAGKRWVGLGGSTNGSAHFISSDITPNVEAKGR